MLREHEVSAFVPADDDYLSDLAQQRDIQRRFLRSARVRAVVELGGLDQPVYMAGGPTYRDVQERLLPNWRGWFVAFLQGGGKG